MAYQNLFEALQNVCGFTALESDMFEIIDAYEKDKAEQLPQADVSGRSEQLATYLQYVIGKKYNIYFEQQDIDGLIEAAN